MSTPIVNPPQVGILGLHAIKDRPVAVDGQVVLRPMMYVALTYDHRIVDGAEAVRFLVRDQGTHRRSGRAAGRVLRTFQSSNFELRTSNFELAQD